MVQQYFGHVDCDNCGTQQQAARNGYIERVTDAEIFWSAETEDPKCVECGIKLTLDESRYNLWSEDGTVSVMHVADHGRELNDAREREKNEEELTAKPISHTNDER